MRKRVLMSSVAATVVASMFMFTGCNNSNSNKEVKAAVVESTPVATNTAQVKQKPVATPAARKVCTVVEGGIAGVQVVGYDDNGNEMDRTRSDASGKVCFAESPASIKVVGSGMNGNLKTHCSGDAQEYIQDGEVKCAEVQSSGLIDNPEFFRSVVGSVYEAMGVPFKAYDKAILEALQEDKITGLLSKLQNVHYLDPMNRLVKMENTPWQHDLIEHVVNIYNSKVTLQTKEVVLTALSGLVKMGPVNVGSMREGLTLQDAQIVHLIDGQSDILRVDGNNGVAKGGLGQPAIVAAVPGTPHFNAHDTILRSIERFLESYQDVPGGINTKAVAIQFLNGNFAFRNIGGTTGLTVVDTRHNLVAGVPQPATGQFIANCIPGPFIECAPISELFVADGLNLANAATGDKMTFTNMSSVCGSDFIKLDKDGNEIEGYETPAIFAHSMKYIHLTERGKALPLNLLYPQVRNHIANAVSMELSTVNVDIEENLLDNHGDNRGDSAILARRSAPHSGIASFVLEFPDACDHEDESKLEYLTVSYFADYNPTDARGVPVNPALPFPRNVGNGSWQIVPNPDLLGNVNVLVTGRVHDDVTDKYDEFQAVLNLTPANIPDIVSGQSFNILSNLMNISSLNNGTANGIINAHQVRELLVKKFTDVDGEPSSFTTKFSMMRYTVTAETAGTLAENALVGPRIPGVEVSTSILGVPTPSNNFVDRIVSLSRITNPTATQAHFLAGFKSQLSFIGNTDEMDPVKYGMVDRMGVHGDISGTRIDDAYRYAAKANTPINAVSVKTCLH